MPQTKERHAEYMRKYREKKRLSQKPQESKPIEKPVQQEPIVKPEPTESNCSKFRRLRTSSRRNPDDGFFCDDHLKNCLSCQNWYVQHKHEDEWDFGGVSLWGDVEKAGQSEDNEQKQLEDQLAKEGFDYKRSSNPSENVLGAEGSKEVDRHFFDDPKQERNPKLDQMKEEMDADREIGRIVSTSKKELEKWLSQPEEQREQPERRNDQTDNTTKGSE